MKKSILLKIRSNAGESIGETLVALLISALALLMLAGAISSAAGIVTRNKASIEAYYVGESGASQQKEVYTKWEGKVSTSLP